ncbi:MULTISPECIES: type IV pilus modification PilV family protein [Microbacterium]|uniref:Prepilin-type N-terminal cleavage/methylation domain-containing protein n=1 Tax=Microbacterium saccharophilum TaxID=1213358 RepID=A0A7Z7CYT7_9MICO|nr:MULTISPECIES: prepilin-type N-terminal cleavage/methylation domain-containing protein [Microbacterium]SFI37117.1 prepilin-type N-terminal cleavage/methylation domain-containing protein [Microbacterium saccharophilum]
MTTQSDDGFSLVEVIIAMFLFAVISLAVLPLLISGVSLSTENRDVVAATTLANDRIAQLREQFPTSAGSTKTCSALVAAVSGLAASDPANPGLVITASASADPGYTQVCPPAASDYPRSVLVTVTVADSSATIARVPTRLTVGAAS